MRCVADRIFGKTDESCFTVASDASGFGSYNSQDNSRGFSDFNRQSSQTNNSPNGVGTWTQNL